MPATRVRSKWVNGNLQFIDARTGQVLVELDAANSRLLIPAGSRVSSVDGYTADGLGGLMVARATFDPSGDAAQCAIGAHGLGVTLPEGAIVVGGFVDVVTAFSSAGNDAGTIALSVEAADDIVAAVAINDAGNPWAAGRHAIKPKADTPESTGVKTTAAREITATVALQALTAGKAVVFLYYVMSD
jgi:hypothetical protein